MNESCRFKLDFFDEIADEICTVVRNFVQPGFDFNLHRTHRKKKIYEKLMKIL